MSGCQHPDIFFYSLTNMADYPKWHSFRIIHKQKYNKHKKLNY